MKLLCRIDLIWFQGFFVHKLSHFHIGFTAGFYTLDPRDPSQLILGPFHGKPACQTIALGRGVCGSAAAKNEVVRVKDVREFEGHIACDGDSRSEIVVPIVVKENVR